MNREFLKNAGVPDEAIEKIMAEYGKDLQSEKDKSAKVSADLADANKQLDTYKSQIAELEKKAAGNDDIARQLKDLQDRIAAEKKAAEEKAADERLTSLIREAFPKDKKFVNEYTEQAMIAQIKAEMNKAENKGKGVSDIFTALTKDKADIFANPNRLADMTGVGNTNMDQVDDSAMRAIMGLPTKKE